MTIQLIRGINAAGPGGPKGIGKNKFAEQSGHGIRIPGADLMEGEEEEEALQSLPNPTERLGRMPSPGDVMGKRTMPKPEEVMRRFGNRTMPNPDEVMGRGGNRAMPNPDEVMTSYQVQVVAQKIVSGM